MCIVKKRLKLNPKTKEYLKSLPKIYLVVRYAKWGVQEYCFSGKFTKDEVPLVYNYVDFNGEKEPMYLLQRIDQVTAGDICTWYDDYDQAWDVAGMLNDVTFRMGDILAFMNENLDVDTNGKLVVRGEK